MTWKGSRVLAVVPARGGSKGIPRKNLRHIAGRSLIAHCADLCAQLPWLDLALLSTDDAEIAAEGRAYGLAVPFMRPAELAGDTSTSVDMWRHAWLAAEADHGKFDLGILLEPTSPLRRIDDVEGTLGLLLSAGAAAAATVSVAPGHFTPHKCLTLDDERRIGFFLPQGSRHSLRQSIPPFYYRNGLCYAVRRETLVERGHIIDEDCAAMVVRRPVVNIDEPFDLELAEFLFART